MDAMWHPDAIFEQYISSIKGELQLIKELTDAGHIAKTTDIMERVVDTGIRKLPKTRKSMPHKR